MDDWSLDLKALDLLSHIRRNAFKVVLYLNIVDATGDGKVNAEYDDKNEQADQQKEPVLPPKFHTWTKKGENVKYFCGTIFNQLHVQISWSSGAFTKLQLGQMQSF